MEVLYQWVEAQLWQWRLMCLMIRHALRLVAAATFVFLLVGPVLADGCRLDRMEATITALGDSRLKVESLLTVIDPSDPIELSIHSADVEGLLVTVGGKDLPYQSFTDRDGKRMVVTLPVHPGGAPCDIRVQYHLMHSASETGGRHYAHLPVVTGAPKRAGSVFIVWKLPSGHHIHGKFPTYGAVKEEGGYTVVTWKGTDVLPMVNLAYGEEAPGFFTIGKVVLVLFCLLLACLVYIAIFRNPFRLYAK